MTAEGPRAADDADMSLALAMVCASPTPLLLLDGDCRVIAASASFCQAFEVDPRAAVGEPIFALGAGAWDLPQLRSLIEATASGDAAIESYELDLDGADGAVRKLVLNVRKLAYGDRRQTRLMVAVADETQARVMAARGRVLSEKNALLVQEMRHRIANSLQIIASVMMLNARRTASEETRVHLREAHSRVMSVAELQKQLAASEEGDVAIRPYLTRLCQTITASMIGDPEALSIGVTADEVGIDPDVSVSLGLIVTELVINALKHAFPGGRAGRIEVSYAGGGAAWRLSVSDDGVGMPVSAARLMPGLGTSIVQALAGQLGARVEVADAHPGTCVSIVRAATSQPAPTLRNEPSVEA